jgi:helix-turn-helix protein
MSLQAMIWALDQYAPPIPKLVLIGMANYAGVENTCWPAARTLCKPASACERSVRAAIADLEHNGLIAVERRAPKSSMFTLKLGVTMTEAAWRDRPKKDRANRAGSDSRKSDIDWGADEEMPANVAETDPANHAGSPPCKPCRDTLQTVQGDPANCAGNPINEPPNEPPKEGNKRAALPRVRVPDVVDDLFKEGLPILIGLTGMTENRCRGMLGKLRKAADDDCPRVLDALHRATDVRPSDPFPWLLQAVRTRPEPLGVIDQIRHDWNLPTFLKPDFDDEPATPELARIA